MRFNRRTLEWDIPAGPSLCSTDPVTMTAAMTVAEEAAFNSAAVAAGSSAITATAGATAGTTALTAAATPSLWSTVTSYFAPVGSFVKSWGPLFSGGSAALGALQQGNAAGQQAELQSEIYRQQAQRQREIAQLEARRIRESGDATAGRTRALLGSSSRDPSSGSALLIQENQGEANAFDEALALAGGDAQASRQEQQAVLTRLEGSAARRSGYYRSASNLLYPAYAKFG